MVRAFDLEAQLLSQPSDFRKRNHVQSKLPTRIPGHDAIFFCRITTAIVSADTAFEVRIQTIVILLDVPPAAGR